MDREGESRGMETTSWTTAPGDWPLPVDCLLQGVPPEGHMLFPGTTTASHLIAPHLRGRFPHSLAFAPPTTPLVTLSVSPQNHVNGVVHDHDQAAALATQSIVHDSREEASDVEEEEEEDDEDEEEEEEDDDEDEQIEEDLTMNHAQRTLFGNADESVESMTESHVPGYDTVGNKAPPPECINHQAQPAMINSMLGNEDQFASPREEENDPNSGFSVYGKMYFEGRVVLHLKQWTEGENGDSQHLRAMAAEDPTHKGNNSQLHGCAMCRLRGNNGRNPRDAHRHAVRGLLFTFEDCIIVELYPESLSAPPIAAGPPVKSPPPVPLATYVLPTNVVRNEHLHVNKENHREPSMPNMVHDIRTHVESSTSGNVGTEEQSSDATWWEEFESQRPPSILNLKLNGGRSDEDLRCTHCQAQFLSPAALNSHRCCVRQNLSEHTDSVDLETHSHGLSLTTEPDMCSKQSQVEPNSSNFMNVAINKSASESSKHGKVRRAYECPTCTEFFPSKRILREHVEQNHERTLETNPQKTVNDDVIAETSVDDKVSENVQSELCIVTNDDEVGGSDNEEAESNWIPPSVIEDSEDDDEFEEEDDEEDDEDHTNGLQKANHDMLNDESPEISGSPEDDTASKENRAGKRRNRREGSGRGIWPCGVCGKTFSLQRRLLTHEATHGMEPKASQCDKCGKRFARKDKLVRHMFVHSEEKMFACDTCHKRFSRRDKLADHLKSHGTEELHNCQFCQKQFLRPDILKQHVKLHGMRNKHQCPDCLRFVTGKERLEKHMARHEEARAQGQTLLCPLCTKYFIQRQSLKAHLKKFHPDALSTLNPSTGEPSSSSVHTATTTTTSTATRAGTNNSVSQFLHQMMKSRTNGAEKTKLFPCSQCSRSFVRKQALKKHLNKHNLPSSASPMHHDEEDDEDETGSLNERDKFLPPMNRVSTSSVPPPGAALSPPPEPRSESTPQHPSSLLEEACATNTGLMALYSHHVNIPSSLHSSQHPAHAYAATHLVAMGSSQPSSTTSQTLASMTSLHSTSLVQPGVTLGNGQSLCGPPYMVSYAPYYQ